LEITTIILLILAVIFSISGLIGLILPALPGSLLLLIGIILAAWAEDFMYISTVAIIILVVLTVFSYVMDFLATALGAKKFGASPRASIGAAIGAIVGMFLGLIGIIIGPFIGAFIGELTVNRKIRQAGEAGIGAWLGMLLGTAAKIAIGFTMVGIYIFARFT
jgi:uncharacterized protein YqgC (DUF456 family)